MTTKVDTDLLFKLELIPNYLSKELTVPVNNHPKLYTTLTCIIKYINWELMGTFLSLSLISLLYGILEILFELQDGLS